MDNQSLIALITASVGILIGAILGGGTVLVMYGKVVKSVLESPVILKSLEGAFASLPAEVRTAIHDTGEVLVQATDETPTEVKTTTITQTSAAG